MSKFMERNAVWAGIVITLLMIFLVDVFNVPNPNVILITVVVYFTFLGGFVPGFLSGALVIVYSMYFFSEGHDFFSYNTLNLEKIVVIAVFIPITIYIVGRLKKNVVIKTRELERLSREDVLIGISNRRYFLERFDNEYRRAIRNQTPISLIIIDIDYYKEYNDTYGHMKGDVCLGRIAGSIENSILRPGDFCGRFGGDEFIVLLNETGCEGAETVARRIAAAVAELDIPHVGSKVAQSVTVSMGIVSMIPGIDSDKLEIFNKADKALYRAKTEGRNRFVTTCEETEECVA